LELFMRRRRYPLEPVAELRESKVDHAVRGLAVAIAGRDEAERGRRAAEDSRVSHDTAASGVRSAEADALARGELSVADLARADAWEVRVAAERAALTAEVDRTRAAEGRARAGEETARGEVASRRADARVIENDRARWTDAQRRQAEANEEEAASEAWRPKR
jgi:hypothetical protein